MKPFPSMSRAHVGHLGGLKAKGILTESDSLQLQVLPNLVRNSRIKKLEPLQWFTDSFES